MSVVSGEDVQTAGPITIEQLQALFRSIEEQERLPHKCIVHPKGGVCLDCGQPWRLVNGRMEPVVFGRDVTS